MPLQVKYDHKGVQCHIASEVDTMTEPPGAPATCCVCSGHGCRPAEDERRRVGKPLVLGPDDEYEGDYVYINGEPVID